MPVANGAMGYVTMCDRVALGWEGIFSSLRCVRPLFPLSDLTEMLDSKRLARRVPESFVWSEKQGAAGGLLDR